ncbi:bis(5'-nucleosyl)-tetraphosphatase [Salinirubellus salinus]|uniref:Bis(5'-nucleosyl)-tetraphosphatase [asymmetrical] n=1 Tax=Salinirubellus salinus TaxID=1364945 RepID=A0A9E7R3D9_9EURY|nr:bis(5'-nucleosyl)-tetraphosphatase [Salinirubellus salinus]UWM55056.1 bis(5'-nucleosyl)-tetraphosphatase [Salinirubellus salinus]
MIEATSAGAILFRDTRGRREYLLLKSRPGDWEFPKGGIEGEEELQQTAIREVKEEAGINDFRLIDGFREDYDYVFEANGKTIHKTVHLFIAKSFEASAELSKEHRDLQWRDYEQAINTITQDGPRDILRDAHVFLDEVLAEEDDEDDEDDEPEAETVDDEE